MNKKNDDKVDLEKENVTEEVKEKSELDIALDKVKELQAESDKYKDNWYRTTAEFENFKKRNIDTRKNAYLDGKKDVILSLLAIGDSLDRALTLEMDEKTKQGIELVSRQFYETLASLNVKPFNPIGEVFDPNKEEAIATVDAEENEDDNIVKTVYKKGYTMDDNIIRYCQVIVTKKA